MSGESLGELILLLVCFVVSALASGTETAMTSVGRLRVRHLVEEGSKKAATLQALHSDPNRYLSTILIVNTLALILAGSAGTLLGSRYLPRQWGFVGDLLVSFLLSILLLIFAEVTPKTLAIRNAERIALLAARPVDLIARALRPLIWFITFFARIFSGRRGAHTPYVTEEELMTILHVSEEQGVIEEEERDMIHGIIEIGDKAVREVMVPRTDMTAIPIDASLADITAIYRETNHTRLPVYEGDLDHVKGLIHSKDVLMFLVRTGQATFEVAKALRPIRFCPESKRVDELLHEMQTKKVHMVIVVDEYGGTAGLVTLEDLLEEIVGEIHDEYDVGEPEPLRLLSPREAVVDAGFPMEELNDRLQLGIPESNEYDSVGGYISYVLGEIPAPGTVIDQDHITWKVEKVNGQRIEEVRLSSKQPWPDEVLVEAGMSPPSRDAAT